MAETNPPSRAQPDRSAVAVRDIGDGVRILTLQRPERMNALDPAAAAALREALTEAQAQPGLRALVLHGCGEHFCTGFDLRHRRVHGEEGVLAILHDCFSLLHGGTLPSVAAVEGNAFGAGLSLALACDQIVAGAGARLCAPFTGIGLVPDVGMVLTLERRVGVGLARRWLFEGTVVPVSDARAAGLVDDVVEGGAALDAAIAQAQRWSGRAPLAIAAVRRLSRMPESVVAVLFQEESRLQAALAESADFKEGVAAFRERRVARFEGR